MMGAPENNSEEQKVHTRLLHLALGVEESRAYWANVNPSAPPASRTARAFEHRWFGTKSERRVRILLRNLRQRYDRFPEALAVLHRWPAMDPHTRRAICHWHLQLADPLYRSFTSEFIERRLGMADPTFDRNVAARWVNAAFPHRWAASTINQFASKLLSAASKAGLITPTRDPRTPLRPKITDQALGYLLYLLRTTEFSGTLAENPYLASTGLDRAGLQHRLQNGPGIDYRRMTDLDDFEWQFPSLAAWAEATL